MNAALASVCGANGNTKRIRTPAQAKAVIEAGWAERFAEAWYVAEEDGHRPCTESESALLNAVS